MSEAIITSLLVLDLTQFYSKEFRRAHSPLNYTLHAVFYYSGAQGGGHYWAYIQDHKTGRPWLYNDTVVQQAREDQALHSSKPGI